MNSRKHLLDLIGAMEWKRSTEEPTCLLFEWWLFKLV